MIFQAHWRTLVESSDLLSYLFYVVGVALLVGSLGYALGAGLVNLIGIDLNLLAWIVGIVVAIMAIAVTFYSNLQRTPHTYKRE